MGRIILIYGVIGGLIVVALMQLVMFLLPNEHGALGMFLGFLNMFIAFSMILVGIKQYRDQTGGGVITFRTGFLIGLGIALIASAFYIASWEAYLAVSGRDYMGEYAARAIENARAAGRSPAELARMTAEMKGYIDAYKDPLSRCLLTFTEIAPVGLLVTLVSAFLLKNPRFLPAKAPLAA